MISFFRIHKPSIALMYGKTDMAKDVKQALLHADVKVYSIEEYQRGWAIPDERVMTLMRSCDYVLICLSADEEVRLRDTDERGRFQGRANVYEEIGIARCCKKKKDVALVKHIQVELPSNFKSVSWIGYDDNSGLDYFALARQLEAWGIKFDIDMLKSQGAVPKQ